MGTVEIWYPNYGYLEMLRLYGIKPLTLPPK